MNEKTPDEANAGGLTTTTPARRLMRLAGMSASIASTIARNKVKSWVVGQDNQETERQSLYAEIGKRLVGTLGEMKGAVMKVGQIASQFKDLFPKEIADALATLQKESQPLPFAVIRSQMRQELQRPLEQCFLYIDPTPFASASIGQVHRARTLTGEEVVIKVQYPGVDACVDSDLKHLRMALKMVGLLNIEKQVLDSIFQEIRRSLLHELDYVLEARNAETMRHFHAHDPFIVIPRVLPELSTRRLLTMSYEPGDSLQQLPHSGYDQRLVNQLGHRLFAAIGQQIYHLHAVHCDPHPGNFAFRPDGKIVIYDFGCIKTIEPEVVDLLRRLSLASLGGAYTQMDTLLIQLGVRNTDRHPTLPDAFYNAWSRLLMQGFSASPFNFATATLHQEVMQLARQHLDYWNAFHPSPKTMLVQRAVAGHYWTMKQLGVIAAFAPDLEALLHRPEDQM